LFVQGQQADNINAANKSKSLTCYDCVRRFSFSFSTRCCKNADNFRLYAARTTFYAFLLH